MKSAVSLPDELFASADSLAKRMRVSRSELYATAVAEFVAKHRSEDIIARLNAAYADLSGEVDPALRRAQARSVAEEWLRDER
ncbi:ChpI protein [Candidatus Palauibacter sp.]|uniref:ChpI protein n=1 Tax=Candidatus Palauibacter sp. TaxID=3101350 RepID=UPI003AF2A4F2